MVEFYPYLEEMIDTKEICFTRLDSLHGMGIDLGKPLIILNSEDSEDEQVVTLLHEVLHYHPRFMSYTGALHILSKDEARFTNPKVEREIDELAYRVIKENPNITRKVMEAIRTAKGRF